MFTVNRRAPPWYLSNWQKIVYFHHPEWIDCVLERPHPDWIDCVFFIGFAFIILDIVSHRELRVSLR